MAYRDNEFPSPLDLFPGAGNEAVKTWDELLPERMRADEGKPIMRLEQLNALVDLDEEPRLRLEYDRFSPALRDRLKAWR